MQFLTLLALSAALFLYGATAQAFDDHVSITSIDEPLTLDLLSLKSSHMTGFEVEGWKDSSPEFAALLMQALPDTPPLPILKQLQTHLLYSGAHMPKNEYGEHYFFTLRLKKLAQMGDAEAVEALLEKIPTSIETASFMPYSLAAKLMAGRIEPACDQVQKQINRSKIWQISVLFCDIYRGDTKGLELDLAILREENTALPQAVEEAVSRYADQENNQKYALESWKAYLKTSLLALDAPQTPLTQPEYVEDSPLSAFYTYTWWQAVDGLPEADKIKELAMFYALLEYRGVIIPEATWQSLARVALRAGVPIPQSALQRLLVKATENNRQMEGVTLALYALTSVNNAPLHPADWQQIIHTLETLGFPKTAKKLLAEGVFSDKRVRSSY